MGRRVAVEHECDRCGELWYVDFNPKAAEPPPKGPDLRIELCGRIVEYGVLCDTCKSTCSNYVDNIDKEMKRKPGAKRKGTNESSPSTKDQSELTGPSGSSSSSASAAASADALAEGPAASRPRRSSASPSS